jgi:hypothetical protein
MRLHGAERMLDKNVRCALTSCPRRRATRRVSCVQPGTFWCADAPPASFKALEWAQWVLVDLGMQCTVEQATPKPVPRVTMSQRAHARTHAPTHARTGMQTRTRTHTRTRVHSLWDLQVRVRFDRSYAALMHVEVSNDW